MAWMNEDDLYIKKGVEKTLPTKGGEYRTVGELREVAFDIDLTQLTEAETPVSDVVFFPAGVQIEEVEVVTLVAATDGTGIDLGFIATDRATQIDYNGILADFLTATMNVIGEKVTLVQGSSTAGVLVGAITSAPGYVTCSRTDSTAFTAGKITVRIKYRRP